MPRRQRAWQAPRSLPGGSQTPGGSTAGSSTPGAPTSGGPTSRALSETGPGGVRDDQATSPAIYEWVSKNFTSRTVGDTVVFDLAKPK